MASFVLAVDQGSSATKVLALDPQGRPIYQTSRPLRTERPKPSHVEQDPVHVLEETRDALNQVIASVLGDGHDILCMGLACQRSSFLLWNRDRGEAFTPIISWQDLRAQDLCNDFQDQRETIYAKTGLPLTGHYGGPKFLWLLRHDPHVSRKIEERGTAFSPLNSYLLWHLTEERVFVTDESIAGRSLLYNIHERRWDRDLLDLFQVPEFLLPQVWVTSRLYGHYRFRDRRIPITCSIGDHQAALLGLGGFEKGQCAINYGTSAGVLTNVGATPQIIRGLLSAPLYSDPHEAIYEVEGTVNAVGSLFEWFEKEQNLPNVSRNWENLMAPSSRGWILVPGMYGIAAPYWHERKISEFVGEGEMPDWTVLVRAAMESIAFLVADCLERIRNASLPVREVFAAGGVARDPLLQFQADLLGLPVRRSSVKEATALGCGLLAGLQRGLWKNREEVRNLVLTETTFEPRISSAERQGLLERWHQVLRGKGIG